MRLDALFNRLFIEPSLGLGYPIDDLHFLNRIERYYKPGDEQRLRFSFDFIGLQYYFRLISKFSLMPPLLFANEIPAAKRKVETNTMGYEIFPKGLYKVLKKFSRYKEIKDIIITESGVCLDENIKEGQIKDSARIDYYKKSLACYVKS